MKVTYELENIENFNAWSGAVQTVNAIVENGKQDEFMFILDDIFPNGCTETELNDFLWFDDDFIFSALDIKQNWISIKITLSWISRQGTFSKSNALFEIKTDDWFSNKI